ncbi:MAG: hypothetical protein HY894_02720 [Deltaproteobacteria bacterium]|nr:hypothetical protein [Deltaproteobacteria bacterium]
MNDTEYGETTAYLRNEVLRKRPYLTVEMCRRIIQTPYRKEAQPDGRIRFWGKVPEIGGRWLRVATFEDGTTVHNAFADRGFKP